MTENEEYEYEMFFKSEESDFCKIDGWYPIATDRIKDHGKIPHYLETGLLRRIPKQEEEEQEHKAIEALTWAVKRYNDVDLHGYIESNFDLSKVFTHLSNVLVEIKQHYTILKKNG